ncbi:hypothetical protein ABTW95_24840 [Spirillospora sp. NPDC127506]
MTEGRRIDTFADENIAAAVTAERLAIGAVRINAISIMPLPAGFWFGARARHNALARDHLHAVRQRNEDSIPAIKTAAHVRLRTPAEAMRVPNAKPQIAKCF